MAAKSSRSQASTKRPAASFSGEPGLPTTAPIAKSTSAIRMSGRARVTRRRRRSASGERLLTFVKGIDEEGPAPLPFRLSLLLFTYDYSRLGDRRLHVGAGPVGLSPGPDRRHAHSCRVCRRGLYRQPDRAVGPESGVGVALCAVVCGARRAAGWGGGGGHLGEPGAGVALAVDPEEGAAPCRRCRWGGADCRGSAWAGLGLWRRRPACPRYRAAACRRAAFAHSPQSQ